MQRDVEQGDPKDTESGQLYIRKEVDTRVGKYTITLGDFLKNAGIVGFKYMLDVAEAREGTDFGISENGQTLWLDMEFAKGADWTDMYFKAFIKYFGPFTVYQEILERIRTCLEKIETGMWKQEKKEKDDIRFLNNRIWSKSYQAAFENIKAEIKTPEVYEELKNNKLNIKMPSEELKEKLLKLLEFLKQPKCKEYFMMKSIIYNYINCFWDNKSFLRPQNATKDIRNLFEKDFSEPFSQYLKTDHNKSKELCIDCGEPINRTEKVSIAFMNEISDDLSRKRSAFWNCKVDAFLCPGCALIYALSPLGFRLFGNKFVFVNISNSIKALLEANAKLGRSVIEAEKKENQKYSQWIAETTSVLIREKTRELMNIQVILRGMGTNDRYVLRAISRTTLKIISTQYVWQALKYLGKAPYVKIKGEYVNVYNTVVMNLFFEKNQYSLLNQLMKALIESDRYNYYVNWVYVIELWSELICSNERINRKEIVMYCGIMKQSGADLRKSIMETKGKSSRDSLRGIEYQLLNALSTRNMEKFMDIVLRLYSSYGTKRNAEGKDILIPTGFVQMLSDKEKFTRYGYAFVMGLEGCYESKKEEE